MPDPLSQQELLRPYLPRLVLQWLTEAPEGIQRTVEGSIAFVDISGFTRLSERLAKRGKVGAEELAEAIGACFARLLGIAYGNGGGLIKFGGDALLLLFTGPDHPARAARAAVGMRRELREIGSLSTPGGRVALKMSVGVHSGSFNFFLVGDSHRELIITGPDASQTVLMESTAEAGEIVVSPTTAAALPAGVLGDPKGPGFLLRKEPSGMEPERRVVDVIPPTEEMLKSIPTATREHVLAGLHDPGHKRVTVAFIHFDGTDALIQQLGADACADALDALVSDIQRAADRNGVCFLGSDVDRDGGKIILTAGVPTASGSDEERMLLTLREIVDTERALPVRVGVNRGHVFAGDIGPFYRRTYTVMGDAVNLAARLMAKAQPDEIISTESVWQTSRTNFEVTELEPFLVKGKAQPVHAFRIGELVRSGTRAAKETSTPLIGREHEMKLLLEALSSARRGEGRIVEIVGEPGIGKSRLIEELRNNAADLSLLSAACELYHASTPYSPLVGLLRRVFSIPELSDEAVAAERLRSIVSAIAPHLMPWVPLLGIALGISIPPTPEVALLDDEFRRLRLEEVTVELVTGLLGSPTLFVIEDTHWMDEASSDLLQRLTAEIGSLPWLVCVTRRDVSEGFVAKPGPAVEVLRPQPLDHAALAAMVEAATEESPLAPHEIAALSERSGGNPLFLNELLAAARDAGGIEGLPDTVEALITARIDRLPPRERTVLKRLSVLGPSFHGELARAVIPDDVAPDEDEWDRLEEFIAPDGPDSFRFRHALIRDAAYEGLPYRLRRNLHALVGETIERASGDETEENAEILSLHYFYARRFDPAWHYSRRAGDRAGAIYANIEAADFYERAIESAKHAESAGPTDVARVFEALGDVRKRIGEFPRATQAYGSARRLVAADTIAAARLLLKQARVRQASGRFPDAIRWIRRADRSLASIDGPDAAAQRSQAAVAYAAVRKDQGRQSEVIKWSLRAIPEAEAAGDRDALAHAYTLLESAFVNLGMWEKAIYSGQALALYEELGDLWGQGVVYNNLGIRAYFEGKWNDAVELYDKGRIAWEKIGDAVNVAIGTVNAGEILSDQGRLDEAEPLFRKALRVWKAAGDRSSVAYALSNLGRLAYRRGSFDEAMELLEEARSEFQATGADADAIEAEARIAECHLLSGRIEDALEMADALQERTRAISGAAGPLTPMLYRIKGYALLRLCDLPGASEALHRSHEVAKARNARYEVGLTLAALAELAVAEGVSPDAHLEECRTILDGLGVVAVSTHLRR